MIRLQALEAKNRARAEQPVVVLLTRRRLPEADAAVRDVAAAAREARVDAIALDVDDPANTAFLDDLGVDTLPEMLVFARGVVLERSSVKDADDVQALLNSALPRSRR